MFDSWFLWLRVTYTPVLVYNAPQELELKRDQMKKHKDTFMIKRVRDLHRKALPLLEEYSTCELVLHRIIDEYFDSDMHYGDEIDLDLVI